MLNPNGSMSQTKEWRSGNEIKDLAQNARKAHVLIGVVSEVLVVLAQTLSTTLLLVGATYLDVLPVDRPYECLRIFHFETLTYQLISPRIFTDCYPIRSQKAFLLAQNGGPLFELLSGFGTLLFEIETFTKHKVCYLCSLGHYE
jgi:hypothetical protein